MPQALPSRCSFGKRHKGECIKIAETKEILGVLCVNCWKEWILPRFVQNQVLGERVLCNGVRLFRRKGRKRKLMVQSCFAAFTSRQEVAPEQARTLLEIGDHIMWRRTYILWHHAIVIGVSGVFIQIIHWSVDENQKVTVHEKVTNAEDESGTMYKVVYGQKVLDSNPSILVLARARALIGITGYSLLDRHCENFAMYCKTGVNANFQLPWMVMKILCQEITTIFQVSKVAADAICISQAITSRASFVKFVALIAANHQMSLARVSSVLLHSVGQFIGGALVVLTEGSFCAFDILTMINNYRKPTPCSHGRSLSRNDLVMEVTTRTCEALFGAACTIGGAIGFEILLCWAVGIPFGPAGMATGMVVGIVVGCVVGGTAGGVVGRVVGNVVGNLLGRAIVATFKSNDRVINLEDVVPGDHLVFNKGVTHPRCHDIVTEVNYDEGYVEVIKNTYKRGVVKVRETFNRPVYRVMYKYGISLYSKREIVQRAEEALTDNTQQTKYNILTSNCKHFCYRMVVKKPRWPVRVLQIQVAKEISTQLSLSFKK